MALVGDPREAAYSFGLQSRVLEDYSKECLRRGYAWQRERPEFLGMTEDEVVSALQDSRVRLDFAGALEMLTSIEALFRLDAERRISRGRRSVPINQRLRELDQVHDGRIPLDELLDAWRAVIPGAGSTLSSIKHHFTHRHWLAHGRHWTNKAGRVPDVERLLNDYQQAEQAIKYSVVDFPRRPDGTD